MKFKKVIIVVLLFVCCILFIISTSILIKHYLDYKNNKIITEQLVQEVIKIDTNKEISTTTIDWQKLRAINDDIVAWIEIPDTNINYPILKDVYNLYYLKHDYNKQYSSSGSIFTSNINPFIENETIIYGHNMKNNTMFSELGKYLKKDFLDSHNLIKIYTPNGNYEGTIFSVYSTSVNDELANLLKDSLSGVRKANLEDHGLEIRKRNRELIIREKKKQKLLSIVELSMMIFVLLLVPVLGTVIVRETVYLWLYIITGPVAAYLANQLRKM